MGRVQLILHSTFKRPVLNSSCIHWSLNAYLLIFLNFLTIRTDTSPKQTKKNKTYNKKEMYGLQKQLNYLNFKFKLAKTELLSSQTTTPVPVHFPHRRFVCFVPWRSNSWQWLKASCARFHSVFALCQSSDVGLSYIDPHSKSSVIKPGVVFADR